MRAAFFGLLLALSACHAASADPLDEHRRTCADLAAQKALRPGLTLDQCARELKARADEQEAPRRVDALLEVISEQHGKSGAAAARLDDAVKSLSAIGRPAVEPTLSLLQRSIDPELRFALSRALVPICAADCGAGNFGCIGPALLEGLTPGRPEDARREAVSLLQKCTGKNFGDDAEAWRAFFAKSPQAARNR